MKKEIEGKAKKASPKLQSVKKGEKEKKEKVRDYYEAESWQFSGCGD